MATVSVSTETRQVPVVKEVEVKTYTLTLSEREAAVLLMILRNISTHGPLGEASCRVFAELTKARVVVIPWSRDGGILTLPQVWPLTLQSIRIPPKHKQRTIGRECR